MEPLKFTDNLTVGGKKREKSGWFLSSLLQNRLSSRTFIEMGENFRLIEFKMPVKHSHENAKTRRPDWMFNLYCITIYAAA